MASASQLYPDHLNPFGSEDEDETVGKSNNASQIVKADEYPDHLSPFGDDISTSNTQVDDYDDSLNPFGDDGGSSSKIEVVSHPSVSEEKEDFGEGNPFGDDVEETLENNEESQKQCDVKLEQEDENKPKQEIIILAKSPEVDNSISSEPSPQPESLEHPPVPLPRTKSLLKKELQRNKQQQRQQQLQTTDSNHSNSLLSTTSSTSSLSTTVTSTNAPVTTSVGSFQRKKNKRNAPPVPINFKRQVSGSLDAIEEELNDIGDKLTMIDKESNLCQQTLKADDVDPEEFRTSRSKFIELIKRKNSIVRRQKELMYRKRELKLDQIHSDIEYELRMIGNKQLSHRTSDDETREKELLKKLVEIVEEKSDIVENLNKDASCDSHDIEEALRRLNISTETDGVKEPLEKLSPNKEESKDVPVKNVNCDKSSIAMGAKLSKIATLLPKGGTIKGKIKIKRKRLFKKCDSRPIER